MPKAVRLGAVLKRSGTTRGPAGRKSNLGGAVWRPGRRSSQDHVFGPGAKYGVSRPVADTRQDGCTLRPEATGTNDSWASRLRESAFSNDSGVASLEELHPSRHSSKESASSAQQSWSPRPSEQGSAEEASQLGSSRRVLWQWEHKSGWKDYDCRSNYRIETAYQAGRKSIRVKSGKRGATPMELFFKDMVQYDPVTENERAIQRLGPDPVFHRLRRLLLRSWNMLRSVHIGPHKDLNDYKQKKKVIRQHTSRKVQVDLDDPHPLYSHRGCFAKIARSWTFAMLESVLIFSNFFWLGVEAEHNKADHIYDASMWIQVGENFYCTCFTLELLIRFLAFGRKKDCWRDAWWMFDLALVLMAVVELWVLPLVTYLTVGTIDDMSGTGAKGLAVIRLGRLFKLLRVGRSGRFLRIFPEVFVQVKAMVSAMKAASWICLLLALLVYSFGVTFVHLAAFELSGEQPEQFRTLSQSTWVLLLRGIFLDDPTLFLRDVGAKVLDYLFIFFICIVGFIVINQLIGVLCTVVAETSMKQKEQLKMAFLKNNLYELMELHDEVGTRALSQEEFELFMRNPDAHAILQQFGVSEKDLSRMAGLAYRDNMVPKSWNPGMDPSPRIPFREFFKLILRLQGSNRAKVTDIVDLRTWVTNLINEQHAALAQSFDSLLQPWPSTQAGMKLTGGSAFHSSQWGTLLHPVIEVTEIDTPSEVPSSRRASSSLSSSTSVDMQDILAQLHDLALGQREMLDRQMRLESEAAAWRQDMLKEHQVLCDEVNKLQDRLWHAERTMRQRGPARATCGWLGRRPTTSVGGQHESSLAGGCSQPGLLTRSLSQC
mmetsp:Transcript_69171/g.129085  ORF Transcript_69171/g.129085 Transcript_69171/m.129085 type:complete len:827 (+) Transcript_69171:64-2544(+)